MYWSMPVPIRGRRPVRIILSGPAPDVEIGGRVTEQEKYSAEAEASSMDPHDWGRAMALAVTRLAEQLAPADSEDIHASLVGRDLHLKISDGPEGVTIRVSTGPISGS